MKTVDEREAEALAQRLTAAEERYRTLFAAMPQGIIHYAVDGSIIEANPAASRILGLDPAVLTRWPIVPPGQVVREDGTPFRPGERPMQVAVSTGQAVSEVVGVPHGQTGEIRWLQFTSVPVARDEQGRTVRAYAIFTDFTEQRRLDAALRESTGLLGKLRDANVLGVVALTEDGAYDANDAFLHLIGRSRADLAAGRISDQEITPPEWAERDREVVAQLRRTGAFEPYDMEYVHRDGHRVPVMVGGAVVSENPLRWVTFVVDLTARQRAEQERAELQGRERAARAEAEYAGERLTFLLRASALVAATHDPQELLENAAQLVVPALADKCVVFMPTPDGYLQGTSMAHSDPTRALVLAELRRYKIPVMGGPMITQAAYTTGTSRLGHNVGTKLPEYNRLGPDLVDVLARLRADSVLATPIMMGKRPAGVLTLSRDAGRRPFSATDLEVAEEFARRLADGLATADRYAREHTIAETLQRSLLPGTSPQIAGLDLAVRYLPASDGVHVGGDWYDAFQLRDGRIALVIGDIAGHDLAAAAVMGQVRSLLRAYALDEPDPSEVLRRTGHALTSLLPDALASAVYAVLDPATGELWYANAGHPPPLVTARAGESEYLEDAPGIMLGAPVPVPQRAGRRRLPRGAALLLYTDGLVEDRDRDISVGLGTLAATLRSQSARTAAEVCDAAQGLMYPSSAQFDDVCLLAVRLPA